MNPVALRVQRDWFTRAVQFDENLPLRDGISILFYAMNFECQDGKCRVLRLMRRVLLIGGLYHMAFAIWVIACPLHAFDFLKLPHPNHPILWQILGVISATLGLGLLIAAKNPIHHWLIVLLGLIKSGVATAVIVGAVWRTELPVSALIILGFDDVVWIPFFAWILWAALRAHAGIPPSRRQPYSIEEAAATYQLSDGRKLDEASMQQPLVLVFLRHFGCTFTRQILRGLQDLEQQAKQQKATLVLVHMLQSGEEMEYLGKNSNILRIADPRCELYRAFGLGKGGFLELFGPQVWWRGAIAIFKGCGVGHLAGDGLQMPGAFVFHQGKVTASQPAQTAADLPNLEALFAGSAESIQTVPQN